VEWEEAWKAVLERMAEIEGRLGDPDVWRHPEELARLRREAAELGPIAERARALEALRREEEAALALLEEEDGELRRLAQDEVDRLKEAIRREVEALRRLLVPKDPNDDRDVIVEIRAGAGGDEAALFAMELLRMYQRYAERRGWRSEVLDANVTPLGGLKEGILAVGGRGADSRLTCESGEHRAQRVPDTEAQGRIHTSTVTVAVLPEVEEVEVAIRPEDLRVETFRSGGAGGQHVNKTESAVRITHLPTGLVVVCQDEKSQHKNRDRALRVLRARLYDHYQSRQAAEISARRRAQVGTGDRSERIRTYNFPQGRVTDHRIGLTLYQLADVLDGDLDPFIEALHAQELEERLARTPE
jgi:peptide chain release factor 1